MTPAIRPVPSPSQPIEMELVIALNVVDFRDYVTQEEIAKMHVMTWGNEIPQEQEEQEENNA